MKVCRRSADFNRCSDKGGGACICRAILFCYFYYLNLFLSFLCALFPCILRLILYNISVGVS